MRFFRPLGIAIGPDGELFVADEAGRIVVVGVARMAAVRTLAGDGYRLPRRCGRIAHSSAARRASRCFGRAIWSWRTRQTRSCGWWWPLHSAALQPPTSPAVRPQFDAEAFGSLPLLWPVAPFCRPTRDCRQLRRGARRTRESGSTAASTSASRRGRASTQSATASCPARSRTMGSARSTSGCGSAISAYVHIRAGRARDCRGRLVALRRQLRRARGQAPSADAPAREAGGAICRRRSDRYGQPVQSRAPERGLARRGIQSAAFSASCASRTRSRRRFQPTAIRVYDEAWRPQTARVQNRLHLAGRVHVVIEAWDQTDDNTPSRRLAPYELGYQVLHVDKSPATGFATRPASLRFDRLGPDADAPHRVYGAGSGIPFYGSRRTQYRYIVTNRLERGQTDRGAVGYGVVATRELRSSRLGGRHQRQRRGAGSAGDHRRTTLTWARLRSHEYSNAVTARRAGRGVGRRASRDVRSRPARRRSPRSRPTTRSRAR